MDGEPVALQRRDERTDLAPYTRYEGGRRNGDGSQRRGDDTDDPLVVAHIHDQVYHNDSPGEEDKRFIHIREGDISVSHGMTLPPANYQACHVDEKTYEDEPEGEFAYRLLFGHRKEEIEDKGTEVNEHRNVKKVRIVHLYPSSAVLRLLYLSNIEMSVNDYYIKDLIMRSMRGLEEMNIRFLGYPVERVRRK